MEILVGIRTVGERRQKNIYFACTLPGCGTGSFDWTNRLKITGRTAVSPGCSEANR